MHRRTSTHYVLNIQMVKKSAPSYSKGELYDGPLRVPRQGVLRGLHKLELFEGGAGRMLRTQQYTCSPASDAQAVPLGLDGFDSVAVCRPVGRPFRMLATPDGVFAHTSLRMQLGPHSNGDPYCVEPAVWFRDFGDSDLCEHSLYLVDSSLVSMAADGHVLWKAAALGTDAAAHKTMRFFYHEEMLDEMLDEMLAPGCPMFVQELRAWEQEMCTAIDALYCLALQME
jgi:hypothetical protein